MAAKRYRNFATVVYPDSAPEDWLFLLGEMVIPCFVSPLHDKDVNPGGEPKKPHYHIVLLFDSVKTLEQAQAVFEQIGGVGCEVVQSLRGYARYLCHMDNPEKFQYCPDDVLAYGGADYMGVIGLAIDRYKAISDMIDFCEDNGIVSYAHLLSWCRLNRFDWFRVLCDSGTVVMREFLKSKMWTDRNAIRSIQEGEDDE